jgi:hypothetical protein
LNLHLCADSNRSPVSLFVRSMKVIKRQVDCRSNPARDSTISDASLLR